MSRVPTCRPVLDARPDFTGTCTATLGLVKTGSANCDERLGGGLARAALHEVFAGMEADGSAAVGFALLLALRACPAKSVICVREDSSELRSGRLYPPGLIELGADPDAILLVSVPDTVSMLRAGADIIKCSAVGAVILEPCGRASVFGLTASRRLALAAARSGVMVIVARPGLDPLPSAAQTRWRVSATPSRALVGNAPGQPAFKISLLRHRGGIAAFDARVEWYRDHKSFRDAPISGGVSALAVGGAGIANARRAA